MIRFALSFLLGVLIFQTSRTLPSFYFLLLLPIIVALYIWFPRGAVLYVIVLGYLWSFVFASAKLLPSLDPGLEGQDLFITGGIEHIVTQPNHYARFVFYVDEITHKNFNGRLPERLILSWYKVNQRFHRGQLCKLTVRLKRHWRFANPGSIDREKQMFMREIGARGYVRNGQCLQKTMPVLVQQGLRTKLIREFSNFGHNLKHAGVMQALTFGEREGMQQNQWEILRATGTSHLLAISGLHLSEICFIVFVICNRLTMCSAYLCERIPAQSIAAVVAMIATSFYAYLAGFSIPTQRALIMVFVALSAILFRVPVVQFPLLAAALFLVLLCNPLVVLSASFWMSFLAVLIIFIILKTLQRENKLVTILQIQIILAAALFPISMWFFNYGSLIAPVVNLIAIPYVGFLLLPILFFAQCLLVVGIYESHYLFVLTDQLLEGLWKWLTLCAELPFAAIQFRPTLLGVIAYEVGLLLLIQARGLPARYISPVFLAALFLVNDTTIDDHQLRVTILDVGQGLAVVVETMNHTLVYDAGPQYPSGFSTGSAVVLPYLQARNIQQVDLAIVSHNDSDHAGGIHALLDAGVVHKLIVSDRKDLYPQVSANFCRSGDEWLWDGVTFRVLHPSNFWQSNKNNRSCVLQIVHPKGKILLTGDIEASVEALLVKQFGDKLRSDLLVVPHHGSYSSSSRRFLASVRPQTAVFSVGYRNRYGFPHAKIMQRYQGIGADLVNTAHEGAVTFVFDANKGIRREVGYRPQSTRYWNSKWNHSIDPRQ